MNDNKPKADKCPICNAPAKEPSQPFCSKRCADVDLHRWLSGGYAIPTNEPAPVASDEGEE